MGRSALCVILLSALIVVLPCLGDPARALESPSASDEGAPREAKSLDLGVRGYGLSLGNSRHFHGLRINLVDRDVEEVSGINITLWQPKGNPDATVSGIALGLLAPEAAYLDGIAIGGLAVVGESRIAGISLGALAVVSDGSIGGFSAGGLAVVADGNLMGLAIGGLASVSDGNMSGISFGGLATVCDGNGSGIMLGGLANVCDGNQSGILVSGLANVCDGTETGIGIAGLANVSDGDQSGIAVAGLANVTDATFSGLNIAGITIRAEGPRGNEGSGRPGRLRGIAVAGAYIRADELAGISASPVNCYDDLQVGISVGIVNYARSLKGVQLGVINIAGNNPGPFKALPIMNAHF